MFILAELFAWHLQETEVPHG